MAVRITFPHYVEGTVYVSLPNFAQRLPVGTIAGTVFEDAYGWPSYAYDAEGVSPEDIALVLPPERQMYLRAVVRQHVPALLQLSDEAVDGAIVSVLDNIKRFGLARREILRFDSTLDIEFPPFTKRIQACFVRDTQVEPETLCTFSEIGIVRPKIFAPDVTFVLEVGESPGFDWEAAGQLAASALLSQLLLGEPLFVFPDLKLGDFAQRLNLREFRRSLDQLTLQALERLRRRK